MNIEIPYCSTLDYDCPFFKCYERGACYSCECVLDSENHSLDERCIDGSDMKLISPPDWCPRRKHEIIVNKIE